MVVGQTLGVGLGAGGVAELNLGEFLGGLDHVVLMTEGVGEDDVAAGISQLGSSVVALLAFGDVRLENILNAQILAGFLGSVDEVQVIGGLLLGGRLSGRSLGSRSLGGGGFGLGSAGNQRENHQRGQKQGDKLFHVILPPKKFCTMYTALSRSSKVLISILIDFSQLCNPFLKKIR